MQTAAELAGVVHHRGDEEFRLGLAEDREDRGIEMKASAEEGDLPAWTDDVWPRWWRRGGRGRFDRRRWLRCRLGNDGAVGRPIRARFRLEFGFRFDLDLLGCRRIQLHCFGH